MNRIILRNTSTGWIAEHEGPIGDTVRQLFDTTILPTGFTAKAEPMRVLAEIQRLNPGTTVELGCPKYATPTTHHNGMLESSI